MSCEPEGEGFVCPICEVWVCGDFCTDHSPLCAKLKIARAALFEAAEVLNEERNWLGPDRTQAEYYAADERMCTARDAARRVAEGGE